MVDSVHIEDIDSQVLKELSHFENFFARMGLKRIDGAVYGLLALSERPLRSEEIEKTLGLSQSAVSMAIKNLTSLGAIHSISDQTEKRVKLHQAKVDALSVVASVFRKREQEYVSEFKSMAQRLMAKTSEDKTPKRHQRLLSIIETCETAESVMSFVINITKNRTSEEAQALAKKLPLALKMIETGLEPARQVTQTLKRSLTDKLILGLEKIEKNLENSRYEK